jgi:uncharacterized protein (TIGR02145 family)
MRLYLLFILLVANLSISFAQNVGIGTNNPNASAKLEVKSNNSGFLPPRMTYAERNAIVNPVAGLMIYCTDCANGEMQFFNGTNWVQMMVTTASVPFVTPSITTNSIDSITNVSARAGGNISSDGGTQVTSRGVVWSTSPNPTIALTTKTNNGTGTGSFTSNITGLSVGITYYVRAYAANSVGTAYGNEQTFTTTNTTFVNFPSVTIGTQIWSTKNLDVARYRNGDPIPQVTNQFEWGRLTTGAWCWYNNDSATFAAIYGRLYNWYAVNDPRGLAPQGWHVPTDAEWNKLVKFIDPAADTTCSFCYQSSIAGRAMMSTSGWNVPNAGATNSIGFSGLPGGFRHTNGTFQGVGDGGNWWASSAIVAAWSRNLSNNDSGVYRVNAPKGLGFSVRVVRDSVVNIQTTIPSITTNTMDSITTTSARSGGNITSDGGVTVIACGVVWSTLPNPTVALTTKTNNGTGTGAFTSNITGLIAGTTYYIRAYATNSVGTAYGTERTFTTTALTVPVVTTNTIDSITTTTARSGGSVTSSGNATISARGVVWSTSPNPTVALTTKTNNGTGTGAFTSDITGLNPGITYYIRAYATNSVGTAYGAERTFTTTAVTLPVVTTNTVDSITTFTARSGGNVTSSGNATITARGLVWSTSSNPTIALTTKTDNGTDTGSFISKINGLNPGTIYYCRAYATNLAGTAYGNQISFTTSQPTAVDTSTSSVTIGTQIWSTKNLYVIHYRNGDPIPQVTDPTQWANLTTGAWCWYNNDSATYGATYGRLYNWYAVNDLRGLAPQGWHVPTGSEWNILTKFIDPSADTTQWYSNTAGGAMKSTSGWIIPNTGATNTSGFSGLPGGYRNEYGSFVNIGRTGFWWSSSAYDMLYALSRYLFYNVNYLDNVAYKKSNGFSVRVVKD